MEVYWEKDDKRVSTNEQRMTQNFQDNSLTISGTIVRDSGVYTCIITNGLDEDRAYAILTVKGLCLMHHQLKLFLIDSYIFVFNIFLVSC